MEIKAVFIGYQGCLKGHYPIYNILGGEHHGSTVSEDRLKELGIEVPYTPTKNQWIFMKNETLLVEMVKKEKERRDQNGK